MRRWPLQLTLESRLHRFLAREEEDERRAHREVQAQPVDVRVMEGVCIRHARYVGQRGNQYVFEVEEDSSKFRAGDPVSVGDGDGSAATMPLAYAGYDADKRQLRLERDPYQQRAPIDLVSGREYCIDKRSLNLQDRLRGVVTEAMGTARVAALFEAGADAVQAGFDAARHERAVQALANRGLNEQQVAAGARAIATDSLYLVQGPPGTGKTRLLAEVVRALCERPVRVVLCAFTHRAVDNALLAIRRAHPTVAIAKVGSSRDSDVDLRAAGITVTEANRGELPAVGVVAGTCYQIAKLGEREKFHYAVFDEAGQLPIPHAFPAMLRAHRWLFFGDHKQLPPVVTGHHQDREASGSVFEYLHERHGSHLLDVTYRMNAGVCGLVSEAFYGGRLHPDPSVAARAMPFVPGGRHDDLLDPAHPVAWLRIDHHQPGQRSAEEAHAVGDIVEDLLRQHGIAPEQVAVIAPFRAQGRLVRSALQRKQLTGGDRVLVDTVERIQGQEREVVVLTLATGDPAALTRSDFFLSANRVNVAISRARSKVVLVASPHAFTALPMDVDALRTASLLRRLRDRMHVVDATRLYCGG